MTNKEVSKRMLKPQAISKELRKRPKILRQIENILAEDEVVERCFDLPGCQVCATDRRLLILEGRTVTDYDYGHISSASYSSKRYIRLIVLGIIFMIGGACGQVVINEDVPIIALAGLGLIFLLIGIFRKPEWVDVNIVGISKPRRFLGDRQDLDTLLQIIRKNRFAERTPRRPETKHVDFAETIRKLAELRDDGIITTEEFEEKKKKLLSSD